MWSPLSYSVEFAVALVSIGLFCRMLYLIVLTIKGRNSNTWISLRSRFGAVEFIGSFAPFLLVGILIFLAFSGLGTPYSAFLRLLDPGIDNWLFASCLQAGFNADIADNWQQTRVFLAVLAAMVSVVPIAVASGFGPRLHDNLVISNDCLIFPARFFWTLGGRPKRKWSELSQLRLDDSTLTLSFTSGHRVLIPVSDLDTSAVFNLFEIASKVKPDCVVPNLYYQNSADINVASPDGGTFTELWETDFKRSYRSTTFIPLSVGQKIYDGKYKVVDQLASTALSATYLATADGARRVVLKECAVRQDSDSQSKARELLLRECEMLSSIRHQRITRVLDTFSVEGRVYLVLDYIPGKTLNGWLKEKGKVDEMQALAWALTIAEMLEYLHGREPPIIHRDITPHNLIVDFEERLNLIDFGAANHFEANATGTLIGKQSFIAPEQLRGKATPQSDIYSFGATLYMMLTGKEPEALSVCHPAGRDGGISGDIDELVADCTQLELESRVTSATELKSRIEKMIQSRRTGEKITLASKEKVPERR